MELIGLFVLVIFLGVYLKILLSSGGNPPTRSDVSEFARKADQFIKELI